MDFKQIAVKKRDATMLSAYFEEYMQVGGMPEYVLTGNRAYLVGLVETSLDDIKLLDYMD